MIDKESDPDIARLVESRSASSVLKQELILLRQEFPDEIICVFEGIDDLYVYYQWFKRLSPLLAYEPHVMNGKQRVLMLNESFCNDVNGLAERTYFFIDRDFDGLAGFGSKGKVFMTDRYSIENYLCDDCVMEDLLKNEFHCRGSRETRSNIMNLFQSVRKTMITATKEINWRIFLLESTT